MRGLRFDDVAVFPQAATARATTDYALLLAQASTRVEVATTKGPEEIATWFYVPAWRPGPSRAHAAPRPGASLLVIEDEAGLGARLAARWRREGHAVTTSSARGDAGAAQLEALVASGVRPAHIVHLGAVTRDHDIAADEAHYFGLVRLARLLAGANGECTLNIVSNGAWAVNQSDVVQPGKALLNGPLRTIPLECPGVACRNVDLGTLDDEAIEWLAAELLSPVREPVVAWRDGQRWVQEVRAQPLAAPDGAAGLREHGVYLITGGLGSMGLAFARELARSVRARLVLTGRSAPSAAKRAVLAEIEALGGEVLFVPADVGIAGSSRPSCVRRANASARSTG